MLKKESSENLAAINKLKLYLKITGVYLVCYFY